MFALTSKNPNKSLEKYLSNPLVSSITHNGKGFELNGKIKSGLLKTLKKVYYPNFKRKMKQHARQTKLKRKGSSRSKGIQIDKQLFDYIKKKKQPRNAYAKALLKYWESIGHNLQAAQVPVHIKKFDCCTAADVITEDKDKKLYLWEVKSGFNNSQKQGLMNYLDNVDNSVKNHWELQRHYTTKGLADYGLELAGSQVINVYEQGDHIRVKRRKRPKWSENI